MNASGALAISAAITIGVVTFSPDADACTVPWGNVCRGTKVLAVPSDPPTLQLRAAATDLDANGSLYSTTPPSVKVTDKDGANVDVTVAAHPSGEGRWILTPSTPLVTGATYKVTWETSCTSTSPLVTSPETSGESEVEVIAPKPLPTALGTITVKGPVRRPFTGSGASCDGVRFEGDEVIAQVTLTPDASFVPWAESVGWRMLFDGKPPPPNPPGALTWSDLQNALRASCDSPDATGLTPAPHEISFTATVPGNAAPLTVKATVDFTCANAPAAANPNNPFADTNGGVAGNGGGPAPESSDSGCAVATSPSSTSTLSVPALLLLASSIAFARSRGTSRRGRRS